MSGTTTRVQQESVQSLYKDYLKGNLLVNRRYQRKLVWTLEDKKLLVNTIIEGYPLPLVLLAEVGSESSSQTREIVDGMQRLNALFAFIENEFGIKMDPNDGTEYYFNLEALASTFAAKKEGRIKQNVPVLDAETSRSITEYQIGTSSFSGTVQQVDEIFRRINSAGKKLSSQEVRQAGILSTLAKMVRELSAYVRGDDSKFETLKLSDMANKSIRFESAGTKGIAASDTFWSKNGIFPQSALRESKDEELILDILLDLVLNVGKGSTSEVRNKAYDKDSEIAKEIEEKFALNGEIYYRDRFISAYETLNAVLEETGEKLRRLLNATPNEHSLGRKFQVLFLVIDKFIQQNMHVENYSSFASKLLEFSPQLKLPGGGKNFTPKTKRQLIASLSGGLGEVFQEGSGKVIVTQKSFERDLANAPLETALFEVKAFFSSPTDLNKRVLREKVNGYIKIATAMSNTCVDEHGVIYFGIADSKGAAEQILRDYGVAEPVECNGYHIVGTEVEVVNKGGVDQFKRQLQDYIELCELVEKPYAIKLAQSLEVFEYKGRTMWKLVPPLSTHPIKFNGVFHYRKGSSTTRVSEGDAEFAWLRKTYEPGQLTEV